MAINNFDGKYAFLSNFYPATVFYETRKYPSAEHAFQAAKTWKHEEIIKIQNAPTPGKAKRLGRKCTLRPDWEEVKDDIMYKIVKDKFVMLVEAQSSWNPNIALRMLFINNY